MRRLPHSAPLVRILVALLAAAILGAAPASTAQTGTPSRTVYARDIGKPERWAEAAIFWFGVAELRTDHLPPGRNYVDVRVGYSDVGLALWVNVVDYFVWYDREATTASDLTQYDGVAFYLDTGTRGGASLRADDYRFTSGLGLWIEPAHESSYRRTARGRAGVWDTSWAGAWDVDSWANWYDVVGCGGGPNLNACGPEDYGWQAFAYIPWATLGVTGPPSAGQDWGLGLTLYDRDEPLPAGTLAPQSWPETFDPQSPGTWASLRIGGSMALAGAPTLAEGQTVIRRGSGSSLVEDAWVGGGGWCMGGHMGDPFGDYHGDDSDLYVGNQALISDFPCSSKSYMRFGLQAVPPEKTIVAAFLTLHHWGNADPALAGPSLVQVLTVDDTWSEQALSWNNAPLAQANVAAAWIQPVQDGIGDAPGIPYSWDVTGAVIAARAAGRPLSIAIYSADWDLHGSKYLRGSEEPHFVEARPTLIVVWGGPAAERVDLPLVSARR